MTETPAYPGYATPTFRKFREHWIVTASEGSLQSRFVGAVTEHSCGSCGWTAVSHKGAYVGLFPDKQAAGEALVKHAGYEVLR